MKTNRRQFLNKSALSVGACLIVKPSTLGLGDSVAPNERVQIGTIGVGGKGLGNQRGLARDERVAITAVCDVDANHRKKAAQEANLPDSAAYNDFRELLERKDVDAVMIATPDHWHSITAISAAQAGKDLYCEKPLTSSIGEGRAVCESVIKNNVVLQCGTWRRSGAQTRTACERVRNGYIGELKHVDVGVPGEFMIRGGYKGTEAPEAVPPQLDYAFWQGPAKPAPYTAARVHFNFRWVNDYAPGYITDWGAHFIDVVQWAMGMDHAGPTEVEVKSQTRRKAGIYDAPEGFHIDYRYPNGVSMTMKAEVDKNKWGIKFIGSEGWIFSENKKLEASHPSLVEGDLKDDEIRLYESNDHYRNFIDCIHSRKPTAAPVEAAHRAATACYLGAIAAETQTALIYDQKSERFTNSEAANQMWQRELYGGWSLPS